MEHSPNFCFLIVDGPSAEELDKVADALYRAEHPRHPTCAEINQTAIAEGKIPPYKSDDDDQLRYVTLMNATLTFAYCGEFLKHHFWLYATKVVRKKGYYEIEGHQTFMYRRTLISNTKEILRLYPREPYEFTIRYYPTTRSGRITSIGRSADSD